jgi:hypothetical protein
MYTIPKRFNYMTYYASSDKVLSYLIQCCLPSGPWHILDSLLTSGYASIDDQPRSHATA